jgi:putative glycosyltransferase (TIGR04372 family)
LASPALGLLLSPVAIALHIAGFRRLTFGTARIGHLAAEPDSFLKACALGELPRRRWFFVAMPRKIANEHLLSYWTPRIPVVRNPVVGSTIIGMTSLGLMRYDTGRYVQWYDYTQEIYRLNAQWAGRPALLALTPEDVTWGCEMLSSLGLPPDAWFVCVHARESGFSPQDDVMSRYRNSDPEALIPAMTEIVRRGGWCVRMGDPTTRPLTPLPGVIDYAHHPLRSARLDVVLCAKARFFLGNSSGLAFVSSVFGRPSLLANMVPMSGLGILPSDLTVPKLYWNISERRLLRFNEILGRPAGSYRFATQYERAGIEVRENSPEEILDATIEMLDTITERYFPSREDEWRHQTFMSLLRPNDYGYGAASRVSATFLQKYRHLLPNEGACGKP